MKKMLLFCIIIFVLPTFSMDEDVLELFKAIESRNFEEVKKFIFALPNLSEIDFDKPENYYKGKDIIEFAEESENPEIIAMVRWGMRANSDEKKFFKAAEDGKIDVIKSLLGKKDYLHSKNYESNTALMVAVKNRNIDLARELLRLGARIDCCYNNKDQTALGLAIISKNSEMVTTLLNNTLDPLKNIDQRDADGNTPFLLAMQAHNKEIIEALLPEVPNPFIKNRAIKTAANFATSPEEKELLALAQGRFNLLSAIESGAAKDDIEKLIASELSTSNALKNITDIDRNPLALAVKRDRFDIVELLVQKGADVNQKLTFKRFTPLELAVNEKNSKIVKFLLEKGADPKVVFGTRNITLLMVAARKGDVDIFKMLLAAGVDPLLKDSEGKTALDWAQEAISSAFFDQEKNNLKEIINLLLISYIQHFTQALNTLQRALQK